jgi:hypothetical protein
MSLHLIAGDAWVAHPTGCHRRKLKIKCGFLALDWCLAAALVTILPVAARAYQAQHQSLPEIPQAISARAYLGRPDPGQGAAGGAEFELPSPGSYADLPPTPLHFIRDASPVSLRFDPLLTQPSPAAPDKPHVALQDCPYEATEARECRVHWRQLLISSAVFLTWQNTANVYTGYWYRYETTTGNWWERYANSVLGYKFSVWSDGNPFLDDYVGHPMMGAITDYLWIQNDPKGMTLEFSNTRPYWISRLRALGFSTVYSTEWKLGPAGESGVGHMGDHVAWENGRVRVETGFVSLVTTPVGGTLWAVAEDVIDKKVIHPLEERNRNPFLLMGYSLLNPARATANILRFRPPWFRDSRTVKADSFWSDPEERTNSANAVMTRKAEPEQLLREAGAANGSTVLVARPSSSQSTLPGGTHELGAWWGLSLVSGPVWGYAQNVRYMPIDVRYSYRFLLHDHWALRYSPEVTALAMLDEPTPQGAAPFNLRKRTYGSGLSPEGFQADFLPHSRVQPFLSHDWGFIYFADRVLSPQGSRFMYTIDFGAGVNLFRKEHQALTLGYRYQHLSNANISHHNPGTDANIFYVGVSRFRSKGE